MSRCAAGQAGREAGFTRCAGLSVTIRAAGGTWVLSCPKSVISLWGQFLGFTVGVPPASRDLYLGPSAHTCLGLWLPGTRLLWPTAAQCWGSGGARRDPCPHRCWQPSGRERGQYRSGRGPQPGEVRSGACALRGRDTTLPAGHAQAVPLCLSQTYVAAADGVAPGGEAELRPHADNSLPYLTGPLPAGGGGSRGLPNCIT